MATTTAQPRRLRLQISLRMLLLLMAAVGVSLAVYRWPWEESKQHQIGTEFFQGDIADYVTRSTYHRSWRGTPVLHGPKRIERNKQLRVESNYYEGELQGPRRVYDHRGRLLWEAHYRNGLLHGAFRAGNGEHWYWSGEYWADQPHGNWEFITYRPTPQLVMPPQVTDFRKSYFFLADNAAIIARRKEHDVDRLFIRQRQTWHRGKRHGSWKWETLEGELLNAAEYADDNFVRWNGEPVVEQFWEWLKTAQLQSNTKDLLLASRHTDMRQDFATAEELRFRMVMANRDNHEVSLVLLVYAEPSQRSQFYLPPGERALVPMLCELACTNGLAFDWRYGTLWLVPNVDPAPAFVDRTGVMQIQFPERSPQAREWLAEVDVQEGHENVGALVQDVLAGTSIGAEGSIFDAQEQPAEDLARGNYNRLYLAMMNARRLRPLQRSSRRDAIGFALHHAGFRCEQRGNDRIVLIDDRPAEVPPQPPFGGFVSPFE